MNYGLYKSCSLWFICIHNGIGNGIYFRYSIINIHIMCGCSCSFNSLTVFGYRLHIKCHVCLFIRLFVFPLVPRPDAALRGSHR